MQAPYIDDGQLRPQDEVELAHFVAASDRAKLSPHQGVPFFSGREDELSVFRRVLAQLDLGMLADATYVVEGPPGAGKTALMAQCIGEVAGRAPTPEGRQWLPVIIDAGNANTPMALGRAIDRAIAERLADQAGERQVEEALVHIDRLATEAQGEEEVGAAREAARLVRGMAEELPSNLRGNRNALFGRLSKNISKLLASTSGRQAQVRVKEILDRGVSITGFAIGPALEKPNPTIMELSEDRAYDWNAYQIVLFVDEGQNISGAGERLYTLASIHQGNAGAPLAICVFGLPGTFAALSAVGISRTVAERRVRLGPLTQGDCRKAVARCFAQFQVTSADAWEEAIVARSQNWPQHLAGYLVAALSELVRYPTGKGGYAAAQASLAAAMTAGDQSRMQYYDQRAESLARRGQLELAKALVPELRTNGGLGKEQINQVLAATEPGIARDEMQGFIQAAIHCGFLEHNVRQGTYGLPIPSFGAYLLNEPLEPNETKSR